MEDQTFKMPNFDLGNSLSQGHGHVQRVSADLKEVDRITKTLKEEEKLLSNYSDIQHVQLTKLQFELLNAIDNEKLENASLRDILGAFKVLKDKELVSQGRPTEIHGLVGYLTLLEQEEIDGKANVIDITPESTSEQLELFQENVGGNEEDLPCL